MVFSILRIEMVTLGHLVALWIQISYRKSNFLKILLLNNLLQLLLFTQKMHIEYLLHARHGIKLY